MAQVERAAVVVPGRGYTSEAPLLMYAALAVGRRGGYVHRIVWSPPDFSEQSHAWVNAQVSQAVDEASTATGALSPIVIGKSLASLAASVVADRALTAVWFTPLLTDEPTVAALRRATAPCLLVGGTNDKLWDPAIARSITPNVAEIDGADHGMFVPGPLAMSAAVLGRVTTSLEQFLDEVAWP